MAASIGCKAFMACRQTAAPARRPMRVSAARPAALQTAFLRPACSLNSVCSSFAGMRLSSSPRLELAAPSRRGLSIVAMGGNSIGNTKGGTRRARTRTSGFRARRLTVGGRHVLKNRRKKGRKVLAVGSYRK